jgi:predicted transposase YbfD/YdcC
VPASLIAPVFDQLATDGASEVTADEVGGLLAALAVVPDPRKPRGVRYGLSAVLAVVVGAVCAGMRSFAAIGEWGQDLPLERCRALGLPGRAPDGVTIWRILTGLDADALDVAIGSWLATRLDRTAPDTPRASRHRRVLAVDGKTVRGARGCDGRAVHLMAALDQARGVVLAQVDVDGKTNEIPMFSVLLDQVTTLTDVVVTADAMHAQRDHARYLHSRGAHYLITVKGNQPTLRRQLASLPWKDIPVGHSDTHRGHGRIEKRSIKATEVAAGLTFPHAGQAVQITRRTRSIKARSKWRTETVYAICSLPATLAQPDQLSAWVRGHWSIENRLHWVRDVTFGEDLSQTRTGTGPRVMATLRNLAISLIRLAGHTAIAKTLRHNARDPDRAFALIGINTNTTSQ